MNRDQFMQSYWFEDGVMQNLEWVLNVAVNNWSDKIYFSDIIDYLIKNNIEVKIVDGEYLISDEDYQDDCLMDSAIAYAFHMANERAEEYDRDIEALKVESYRW